MTFASFLPFITALTAFAQAERLSIDVAKPSFSLEVMAVLSRSGCNSGPCHGNLNGKGGLKLSLRGDDAAFDFKVLTHELSGRRVNTSAPEESLLLRKATGGMPHEGGRRFSADSGEYRILKDWISAGCPGPHGGDPLGQATLRFATEEFFLSWDKPSIGLKVVLDHGGASPRELTHLVAWETTTLQLTVEKDGTVAAGPMAKPGSIIEGAVVARLLDRQAICRVAILPQNSKRSPLAATQHPVDLALKGRLEQLGIRPAPICSDEVYLRRLYLDLLGILPTPAEARAFLDDNSADKRSRLVDILLARPEFYDYWALKWADLLRVEEKTLDANGVRAIHGWLRQAFAEDRPLNEIARELVSSRGSTYSAPAANFYRALRDAETRAEAVAQVFLGIRIGCAKCHNHPFDRWKQDDYHALAAALAPIDYRVTANKRKDDLDKHEFAGDQIVFLKRDTVYRHPVNKKPLAPAFLGYKASGPADVPSQLGDWIADPKNPWFARAQANRIWRHMTGKGLVDPEDDFRVTNPASRPELLEFLTERLREENFQLRPLIKLIATSDSYQRAAQVPATGPDETYTAQAMLRPLKAEQLLDALTSATGSAIRFDGYPRGTRSGQLPGVIASAKARPGRANTAGEIDRFLKTFGKPDRLLSCDCERTEDTTLAQSLQLLAGPLVQQLLVDQSNRLGQLLKKETSNEAVIEEIWLASLSRRPTPAELAGALVLVNQSPDRRTALEDIEWGLLVSREFLLRH